MTLRKEATLEPAPTAKSTRGREALGLQHVGSCLIPDGAEAAFRGKAAGGVRDITHDSTVGVDAEYGVLCTLPLAPGTILHQHTVG